MAFRVVALSGNTSTTTGTGDIAIGAALPAPFRSLATVLSDGDTFPYCIRDNVNFECGLATWHSAGGGTFTRTRVDQSSIGNVVINFSSGTRNVFCDYGVAMFMYGPNNGSDIPSPSAFRTALGLGTAATATLGTGANQVPQITGAGKYPAIDGTPFAATTAIAFYQDAAPIGFTRVTSVTDKLLKVTKGSGSGDTTGGTTDSGLGGWDTTFGLTSASHILVASEIPVVLSAHATGVAAITGGTLSATQDGGSTVGHSHVLSSAATWRPPAAYVIIATKN
jgi:hypothetical protein